MVEIKGVAATNVDGEKNAVEEIAVVGENVAVANVVGESVGVRDGNKVRDWKRASVSSRCFFRYIKRMHELM
jgi:hypothetical protein